MEVVPVVSAQDMFEAVAARQEQADYIKRRRPTTPRRLQRQQNEEEGQRPVHPLRRTQDILQHLGSHRRPGQVICGFSMETQNMLENSRAKLVKKNVDMICANNLKVAGALRRGHQRDHPHHRSGRGGAPLLSKEEAANRILDAALALPLR